MAKTTQKLRGLVLSDTGATQNVQITLLNPDRTPATHITGYQKNTDNNGKFEFNVPALDLDSDGRSQQYGIQIGGETDASQKVIISGNDQVAYDQADVDTLVIRNGQYAVRLSYEGVTTSWDLAVRDRTLTA